MRTKSLLIASLLCGFMSANAQESVTTATYGNAAGNTTRTMTVALNHSTDYVAFLLDMTLPEGTTVEKAEIKTPLKNGGTVDLSAKGGSATESTNFNVPFNQNGTNCKLVGYNYGNVAIGGASGEILLTLTLKTENGVAYNADGVTATCTFVENDTFNEVAMETTTDPRLWGDVNHDKQITSVDVSQASSVYLKKTSASSLVDFFAGDMDSDGAISSSEVSKISSIYLKK